jgi:hypothetical protein
MIRHRADQHERPSERRAFTSAHAPRRPHFLALDCADSRDRPGDSAALDVTASAPNPVLARLGVSPCDWGADVLVGISVEAAVLARRPEAPQTGWPAPSLAT